MATGIWVCSISSGNVTRICAASARTVVVKRSISGVCLSLSSKNFASSSVRSSSAQIRVAYGEIVHGEALPVEVQLAPESSIQDGLMDVCIYAPRNLPEVARILWRVARRQFGGDDRMIFLQAKRVRIESDPPVAIQIDGEPRGETPIDAEIHPLSGRVLVPR